MDDRETAVSANDAHSAQSLDTAQPAPVWKRVAGYLFAAACLAWVLHDVHPRALVSQIRIKTWAYVIPAVVFDVLTYVLQGARWSLLLSPVGKVRALRATQAIYAGLFTNELAPLRLGELVRAFLASRWLHTGVRAVIPSMVVERFLDALCLVAGIGFAALLVPLPRDLARAGDILGAVVLGAATVFAWIVVRKERRMERAGVEGREANVRGWLARFIADMAMGMRQIGFGGRFWIAACCSALMLVCQGLAFWFMMLAFGLPLPITAGLVVLLIVRLGTAVPNAPANVGSFQFFTVVALGLYGVDKTTATAFSIVDFIALTAPLWAIGLIAISKAGLSLRSVRAQFAGARSR